MGTVTRMELRKISELHPYEHNAKLHPPEQIEALRRSFREFGMIVPVGIDGQDRVIYGHGRLLAAQAEGWDQVPTVTVEDLSEDQRRAFIHADNLLSETGYDKDTLRSEAQALQAAGDGEEANRWLTVQDKLNKQILTLGETLGLTAEKRKAMGWTLPT